MSPWIAAARFLHRSEADIPSLPVSADLRAPDFRTTQFSARKSAVDVWWMISFMPAVGALVRCTDGSWMTCARRRGAARTVIAIPIREGYVGTRGVHPAAHPPRLSTAAAHPAPEPHCDDDGLEVAHATHLSTMSRTPTPPTALTPAVQASGDSWEWQMLLDNITDVGHQIG